MLGTATFGRILGSWEWKPSRVSSHLNGLPQSVFSTRIFGAEMSEHGTRSSNPNLESSQIDIDISLFDRLGHIYIVVRMTKKHSMPQQSMGLEYWPTKTANTSDQTRCYPSDSKSSMFHGFLGTKRTAACLPRNKATWNFFGEGEWQPRRCRSIEVLEGSPGGASSKGGRVGP